MAKYYNNQKKTGKVAGSVFAIRFGETIERAYNPSVANPKSSKQVEARAKLKLASQLATVLAPAIAIRRVGAQSPRNLFIKGNYPSIVYADGVADIPLLGIQLTKSVVSLPSLIISRDGDTVTVRLSRLDNDVDRVVYVMLGKDADEKLRLLASVVQSEPGAATDFSATLPITSLPAVVLAYGVRFNTENASVVFGDLIAPTAEDVAKIITTSSLLESEITLTETVGVNYPTA